MKNGSDVVDQLINLREPEVADAGCAPYATRAEFNDDIFLAIGLLSDGAEVFKGKFSSTRELFKSGSPMEREGRAALAWSASVCPARRPSVPGKNTKAVSTPSLK
jgi:hypothetical protein